MAAKTSENGVSDTKLFSPKDAWSIFRQLPKNETKKKQKKSLRVLTRHGKNKMLGPNGPSPIMHLIVILQSLYLCL